MSIVLTLAVFATWAVLALCLCAIGVLFLNRLGASEPTWQNTYCAVWLGFALLTASLILWHFFLPVDERALVFFASVAVLALIVERHWFASLFRLPFSRPFALFLIAFAIWTANHALPPGGMDDYTYEFQTIRWFHDYPIIPGLANLHGRLGFNSSHHLFAALLSAGPWRGAVNHLFNGFFILLACILLLDAVRDLARGTKGALERSLVSALLLCPCASLIIYGRFNPGLSTLKADVFVCAAAAVLASLFLRWTAMPAGTTSSVALGVTVLLIAGVTPSIKISTLVFCGPIFAVAAVRLLFQVGRGAARRTLYGALAVVAVIAICFPARGVILSGYPFYPLTAFGFHVDWRVPEAQAEAEGAYITSYARLQPTYNPSEVSGWHWVRGWARSTAITDRVNILLPLMLTLVCIPFFFARPRANPGGAAPWVTPAWAYATLAGASAAALTVWFLQAPAGRFAIGQAWVLFTSVFAWAIQRQRGTWSWTALGIGLASTLSLAAALLLYDLRIVDERPPTLMLFAFVVFWMIAFGASCNAHLRLRGMLCVLLTLFPYGERVLSYVRSRSYATAEAMAWISVSSLYGRPLSDPPVLRQTRSGLSVYDTHVVAYETPLPNTRYFNPYLELRTGRMQDGFRNSSPISPPIPREISSFGYKVEVWERDADATRLALRSGP